VSDRDDAVVTEPTKTDLAMEAAADRGTRWSIERRIPLGLVVVVVLWLGAACGAVAVLYSTVTSQGERITRLEALSATNTTTLQTIQVDVARIFERVDSILSLQRREDAKRP
jgi:hypothetical protein